jgi:hypothetical protein
MYSKAELERLRAAEKKLQQPKAPTPRLRPGGAMTPLSNAVDQNVRRQRLSALRERMDAEKSGLDKNKDVAKTQFRDKSMER